MIRPGLLEMGGGGCGEGGGGGGTCGGGGERGGEVVGAGGGGGGGGGNVFKSTRFNIFLDSDIDDPARFAGLPELPIRWY